MTDIGHMLAETANRILAQFDGHSREESDRAALLGEVRKAGLPLVLLPEAGGGAGLGIAEAAEIARAWGRHAAMLPIAELLLAGRLAPLFGGEETAASVSARGNLVLSVEGEQARLSGGMIEAPSFPGCRRVYARATSPSGDCFMVSVDTGNAHDFVAVTGEPWLRITPEDALEIRAIAVDGLEHERFQREGNLLTVAAMTGAMSAVLDLVVEHVSTRKQFGRPIGKFQAIQHLLADAASELTLTQAVLGRALGRPNDPLAWLSAKAQAGRAASRIAASAHQMFGAMGFTAEHTLHHFTKRLWTWRDEWLREIDCERAVGEMALQSGEGGLLSFLVDRAE